MNLENSIEKIIKKYVLPFYFVGAFFTAYDMHANRDDWRKFENSLREVEEYIFTGQIIKDYNLVLMIQYQIPIVKKKLHKDLILKADTNNNNILELNEQVECLSRLGIKPEVYFENQIKILPAPNQLNLNQLNNAIKSYNTD